MAKFYCEYCGRSFSSVAVMSSSFCSKDPTGNKRHKLYEGSEKSTYTCKYCGRTFANLAVMSSSQCPKDPSGHKRHSPAL